MTSLAIEQQTMADVERARAIHRRLRSMRGKCDPVIVPEPVPEPSPPLEAQEAACDPEESDASLDPTPPRLTVYLIAQVTAEHFGVSMADMLSHRRNREYVTARQIAMYLAKQLTTRSLPFIGRRLGGRDHTTVLHGIRKISRRMPLEFALTIHVLKIEGAIKERLRS